MIRRLFPLFQRLKRYKFSDFSRDLKAGFNVSLLDFPQSMAYAMIAGLPIQFGVHASAIGSIVTPFFASSRFLMIGPSNATAVLLMSGFLSMNLEESQRLVVLPLLILMVSVFTFAGILLRVEVVIQYVSRAVISGYITAAAFLILIKQLRHVIGVNVPSSSTFLHTLQDTFSHLHAVQWPVLLFSVITLLIYFILERFVPKLPNLAITILLATLIYHIGTRWGYQFDMLPDIPQGDWKISLPQFDFSLIHDMLGTAFAVFLLSLLESSSISKTIAARAGDTVDIPQQMISMGIANVVNAFGSGMPISGSPTRSMLNYNSGARTPVSSIVSGVLLVVAILAFSPVIHYIPKAALGTLIIIVGLSLIKWDTIKVFLRTSRSDAATFLVTFITGLVFPLDIAIYFGVGLSVALFLKKVSTPTLQEVDFTDRGEVLGTQPKQRSAISIVHVEGDLFFGSTDVFLDRMRELVESPNLKVIVLRMLNAHHIDATASLAIANLIQFARQNGRDVVLSGVREDMMPSIRKSGLMDVVGKENLFEYTPENITLSTRNALIRAQQIIGTKDTDVILVVKKEKPTD